MNRNKFWTFFFSFCPGAGQMYQGYMKRGLSLILMFVLPIMVGAAFMPILAALAAVVYMYSFFDSLNLRAQILDGDVPEDDFLVHLNVAEEDWKKLLNGKSHLIGWAFVILGVSGLYKSLVEPLLWSLLSTIPWGSPLYDTIRSILYNIPGLCIGVLFILVGLWLIRGDKDKKESDTFEAYKGEDHE